MPKKLILMEDEEKAAEYVRGNTLRVYLLSGEGDWIVKALAILPNVKINEFVVTNSTEDNFLELPLNTVIGQFCLDILVLYLSQKRGNDGLIDCIEERGGIR